MISAAPVPSMPRWEVIARWAAVPVAFLVAYPAALLLMAVVDALNAFDGIGESLSGAIMHSVTPFAATAMGSYYAVAFPAKVAPAFRLHVGAIAAIVWIIFWAALFGFAVAADVTLDSLALGRWYWASAVVHFALAVGVAIYAVFDFWKEHR